MALNRAASTVTLYERSQRKSRSIACVFISHQKADSNIAKAIADYLLSVDIDVYFDEYDHDLRIARESSNPNLVTESIRKGIEASTHMLCIISANTLNSKWVPFEVGYGYDKTQLAVLIAKDIDKNAIPDYVKAAPIILPDIDDLNTLIGKIRGTSKEMIVESVRKSANNSLSNLALYIYPFRTIY